MATKRRILNVSIQLDADEKFQAMQVNVHAEVPDPDGPVPFSKPENHTCDAAGTSAADRTVIEKFVQTAGRIAGK